MKPRGKRKRSRIGYIQDTWYEDGVLKLSDGDVIYDSYFMPCFYKKYYDERLTKVRITIEEL